MNDIKCSRYSGQCASRRGVFTQRALAGIFSVAVLFLAGCATTTQPVYRPPLPNEPYATIEGDKAPLGSFFSAGAAHVNLEEVDGESVRSKWGVPTRSARVAPGSRRVAVFLVGSGYLVANTTLSLNVEAAHTYKVQAIHSGSLFDVTVYDKGVLGEDQRKIFSAHVSGNTSEFSKEPIPVYVPSR